MGLGDGLYGALASAFVGGGFSMLLFWVTNRASKKGLADAWQSQATQLHDELKKQHDSEVAYLRGQLSERERKDRRGYDRGADLEPADSDPVAASEGGAGDRLGDGGRGARGAPACVDKSGEDGGAG